MRISGSVSPTHESYTVTNTTTNRSVTFTGQGLREDVTLQFNGQFGFGTAGGFPPFTQFPFYGITVSGQPLSAVPNEGNSQVDNEDTVLVQTSALNAAGTAFQLTYETNVGDVAR